MDRPADHITCPYTGHKQKCVKHYMNCPKWIHVIGTDSNTGQEINEYQCEDSWRIPLMIENSKEQRQTAAAVESFRNVVAAGVQQILALASGGTVQKIKGDGG